MESHDNLYGRRKGKPLSPRRLGLMATLYPTLAVDVATTSPIDLRTIFPVAVDQVRLEIGFGGGERLIAAASERKDVGFIGVEPFQNGMAKAVAGIGDLGLRNIRLFDGDAVRLLDWLPSASLSEIALFYPDPWPKKRHFKRRFVSPGNLDRFARILAPGGLFRFVSDIDSYVEWTLRHFGQRTDFDWTAERADDWRRPFPDWPGTRYEAKALAEGRTPAYLTFRRR
jgi:tRNA (guanine-N7-)-methyltransferase